MSKNEDRVEAIEGELADIVAEIGERLRRGESVRPEDYVNHTDTLRGLMPAIRMMAISSGVASSPAGLGSVGDFRIVREVSRGGMGVVYEAIQVSLGRRVALKVLPNAAALDPRHLQRFQVEAQAAASLDHPHIVPVYATGSAEGIPYYAMRFIDGRDLARVIRDLVHDDLADTQADSPGPSTPTTLISTRGSSFAHEVARLARQAAQALDHAHGSDVLHRDVKPSNLMIEETGELWITDFGLARVRGGLDLTQTGDALGTVRYMSPEQALGPRAAIDGRTDIYSLGVTMYELLTLRPAFSGDDRVDVLRQIVRDEPTPPRKLDPSIPVDLETIILKTMARSPSDRYTTAADLATDLGLFLENRSILARRPSLADHGLKWMRRHRGLVASLVGTVALILLVLGLAGWRYTALLRDHNAALKAEVSRADRHAENAERLLRLADRHAYASTIRLAGQAVQSRQFESAQDLLESNRTGSGGEDLRDFAWHYLHRLARREIVHLPEQDAVNFTISMSRDGRTLASFHMDSSIVLWDLPSERPRVIIAEAGIGYWDPRLTGDGHTLVAIRSDKVPNGAHDLGIWDATTGELRAVRKIGQFHQRKYFIGMRAVHFLDNERLVAHAWVDESGGTSIRIWALDFDSEKDRPRVELDGVDAVAFASEGPFFATRDGSRLRLRDVSSGTVVREYPGEFDGGGILTLSPDGRMLATASRKGSILVRNVTDWEDRSRYDVHAPVVTLTFDPVGSTLAAVDEAGTIHLCDRLSGRVLVVIPDDLDRCREVVHLGFSPDGTLLAANSRCKPGGDQPLILWDVKTGRRIGAMPSSQPGGWPCFAPDGRSLIITSGRAPKLWHFKPLPEPGPLAGHKAEAWAVAYSADGTILATGSDDTGERQTIKLWDPDTGRLIRGWNGGEGTVSSIAFSPDGRMLASGQLVDRDSVKIWEVSTGSLLHAFRGHKDMVRSVAFAPDGLTLATVGGRTHKAGEDRTIRLWDVAEARCVRELEGHSDTVHSLAFAPDGRTLATASNDRTVRLWDTETGLLMRIVRRPEELIALAFAPDGATLAVATNAAVVTIHDATSLDVLKTIRYENNEELLNVAMAPDGRSLATTGLSGTIRLWDTLTGQELLTLKGHKTQVHGIAFAPDGSSLASCSHDGEVKLWRARPEVARANE